jgi:polysaccharide biosynthesis protein PslG
MKRVPLLLVSGALTLTLPAFASSAAADSFGGVYGVNAQYLFGESVQDWDQQLSAMTAGGLQLVRSDARWSVVEPSPPSGSVHHYQWSTYDSVVAALARHALRWYPVLHDSPSWAGAGAGDASPATVHLGDFAAFAGALAARYGSGGSFWASHPSLSQLPAGDFEIWNEENSSVFWQSQADAPERYADLYATSRQAIKAVDPAARVVVGGLALDNPPEVSDELQFLARMFAQRPDLRGAVDGVGLHPYQASVADTYMRIALVRQAVDQLAGPGVPIDVTEFGWTTTTVSDSTRAADLSALATALPRSGCGIDRLLAYAWTTRESDPSNSEDWFGIWNLDGSPRASGLAYLGAVQAMRGMSGAAAPAGTVNLCASAASSPARATSSKGPRLNLRARAGRRKRVVNVAARCPAGCSLTLKLVRLRGTRRQVLAHSATKFSSRRRQITLHTRLRAHRLQLHAVAVGEGGGRTAKVRTIRLR